MAAENEAKIVITTDPDAFLKFMTDAARALRDVEKEGKKSLKELDTAWSSFKGRAAQAGQAILQQVGAPLVDPIKQALNRALGDARAWRQESTRIMGETGMDWKAIGGEIDAVSLRTKRMPEDSARYLDSVRMLTGSWKFAKDSAEDYSDVARMLGKQTVSEMAPLAVTMQNIFRVDQIKPFFEQAIAGARALGQSGEMTMRQWERLAPMMTGIVPRGAGKGEAFAKSAAAMLPAMQKLGLSPEESELAMQQIVSSYSGDNLVNLERQLRGAGMLARGESLKDKYGRLTRTIPELMQLEAGLIRKHAARTGGGRALEEKLAKQNFAPLMAGLMIDNDEFQKTIAEATGAQPAAEIEARKRDLEKTPELQRQLNERIAALAARKTVGETKLTLQDIGAGGEKPGMISTFARGILDSEGTAKDIIAEQDRRKQVGAKERLGLRESPVWPWQKEYWTGKEEPKQGAGKKPGGSQEDPLMRLLSRETQQQQATATADALGQKVLKVQIVTPMEPMPLSGGGLQ